MNTTDANADIIDMLFRRFIKNILTTDAIRKHVTECKAYVSAFRATADAPDAQKIIIDLLSTEMRSYNLFAPNVNSIDVDIDIDDVEKYLDKIYTTMDALSQSSREALIGATQLPYLLEMKAFSTMPLIVVNTIMKSCRTAEQGLDPTDALDREFILCRKVCAMVNGFVNWAYEWGANNPDGRAGDEIADAPQIMELLNEIIAVMKESKADEKERQAEILAAIGAKKKEAQDNLAGTGRSITRLKTENTTLKAENAALKAKIAALQQTS